MEEISFKNFVNSLPNPLTSVEYRQLEEAHKLTEILWNDFTGICVECLVRNEWKKNKPYPEKCWECVEKQSEVINKIIDERFTFYKDFVEGKIQRKFLR